MVEKPSQRLSEKKQDAQAQIDLLVEFINALGHDQPMTTLNSKSIDELYAPLVAALHQLSERVGKYPAPVNPDRTKQLEAQAAKLAEANQRLQQADRLKSVFLASMSHELRTPLNAIIGFSGILQQEMPGALNDEQKKQVGLIRTSAEHLLALITEILDIAKIEAGRAEISKETFLLYPVVRDVTETFRPLLQQKDLMLISEVSKKTEVFSDQKRLRQILLNLMSNAVKFTSHGSVRVVVRQKGPDSIEIAVADTGIGIAPADLERLFQPFQRLERSSKRRDDGTGLGLYVTQKLVHLLGGQISVDSKIGQGSKFVIVLPSNGGANRSELG